MATQPGINFSPQLGEPWADSPNGLLWVQGVGTLGIDEVVCDENCQIVSAKKILNEADGTLLGYHVAIAAVRPGRVKIRIVRDGAQLFPVIIRNYKPKK
jgi:hypothetical protein